MKSVLWRVAKGLSYIENARCLKVNANNTFALLSFIPWPLVFSYLNMFCNNEKLLLLRIAVPMNFFVAVLGFFVINSHVALWKLRSLNREGSNIISCLLV